MSSATISSSFARLRVETVNGWSKGSATIHENAPERAILKLTHAENSQVENFDVPVIYLNDIYQFESGKVIKVLNLKQRFSPVVSINSKDNLPISVSIQLNEKECTKRKTKIILKKMNSLTSDEIDFKREITNCKQNKCNKNLYVEVIKKTREKHYQGGKYERIGARAIQILKHVGHIFDTEDLAGTNLPGADFEEAKFGGPMNFRDTVLKNCNFSGHDLTGFIFSGANCLCANFDKANISYAIGIAIDSEESTKPSDGDILRCGNGNGIGSYAVAESFTEERSEALGDPCTNGEDSQSWMDSDGGSEDGMRLKMRTKPPKEDVGEEQKGGSESAQALQINWSNNSVEASPDELNNSVDHSTSTTSNGTPYDVSPNASDKAVAIKCNRGSQKNNEDITADTMPEAHKFLNSNGTPPDSPNTSDKAVAIIYRHSSQTDDEEIVAEDMTEAQETPTQPLLSNPPKSYGTHSKKTTTTDPQRPKRNKTRLFWDKICCCAKKD